MTPGPARGRPARVAVLAGSLATAAFVAGCTSVGPAPTGDPGPATTRPATAAASSSTAAAAPGSATPSSSGAPVTSVEAGSAASTTSAAPAPAASAAAPVTVPRSTCTALTIRVLRGSAAPGYEFAALQFENTGTTRCTLYGYPTVSLLSGGHRIGSTSTPNGTQPSAYVLNPGQVAESRLQDYSSCQAPLSDRIRVVAPRSSSQLVRPIQLRACRLKVSRLDAPQ